MQPFLNQQEYTEYFYRRQLRKDANKAGIILLLYLVAMTAFSFITIIIPMFIGIFNNGLEALDMDLSFLEDTTFLMIESGLVSILAFFGVAFLYSIISKENIGKMFPVNKVGFKLTFLLCSFGLAIAMIANYVSNLLLALFDAVGIDAYVDVEYECNSFIDVLLFYITVAVLPALVEEFAFRGVILGILRKHSDGLAVLISGITFGLMHGNFTQIPFALVVGLILGYITVKTNSLLPAMIIHFLNNGLSVTFTLLDTNTNLPDYIVDGISIYIMFIIGVLGIFSFIVLSKKHKGFFKLTKSNDIIPFKHKVKTVCKSPTVIIFTVISLLEAISMLFMEV